MRLLACAALALTLLSATTARAQVARPTGPKADDIRKLLVMTGSAQLGAQVMAQLMQSMKKAMPNVPERFWADFQKEVRTDELIDLIVPVYDRHLSHDDVKALIKFYETPSGKKFVSVLPQITQESMAAGENWGRGLAERVISRLKAEEEKGSGSMEKKGGTTKKK